jgi:hypothetical protein
MKYAHQTVPGPTLLVNARQSIFNAMRGRAISVMASLALALEHCLRDRFSARFCINQQSLFWPGLRGEITDKGSVYAFQVQQLSRPERGNELDAYFQRMTKEQAGQGR